MSVEDEINALLDAAQKGQPLDGLSVKKGRVLSNSERDYMSAKISEMGFDENERKSLFSMVKAPESPGVEIVETPEKQVFESKNIFQRLLNL